MKTKLLPFLKSKKGMACAAAAAILLGGIGGGIYGAWCGQQPKFQDVTVELGTESVQVTQFMTKYARLKKVGFVSDPGAIDLGTVGSTQVTLRHGKQEQTVTFQVVDTTAPQVSFRDMTATGEYTAKAADFIASVSDASKTTAKIDGEVEIPADYRDVTVPLVVTDAWGNATRGEATLHFHWMQESLTWELGEELTKEALLILPDRDEDLLDQKDLDAVNAAGLGTYTIESTAGERTISCTVTVQDTRGPALELQNVCVLPGEEAAMEDFILSAEDPSGGVELEMEGSLESEEKGARMITITARDALGNVSTAQAEFRISTDRTAPSISGVKGTLRVSRGAMPDFLKGVSAEDKVDGECTVTCDDSAVDVSTVGDYQVVYTAKDLSGNTTTVERKVRVVQPATDNMDLIREHAEKCGDTPEEIRDYVRDKIRYNHNWGGDDPVTYGFENRRGNCYVHAVCLQALLEYKGYETQLIWVKNRTHYWLIIKLDEGWRHIDATPTYWHRRYSLMTDKQRHSTLRGRDWDRELWPACE